MCAPRMFGGSWDGKYHHATQTEASEKVDHFSGIGASNCPHNGSFVRDAPSQVQSIIPFITDSVSAKPIFEPVVDGKFGGFIKASE